MNSQYIWQLLIFVAVLMALNALFPIHISILGSLALTVGLSFLFSLFQRR